MSIARVTPLLLIVPMSLGTSTTALAGMIVFLMVVAVVLAILVARRVLLSAPQKAAANEVESRSR